MDTETLNALAKISADLVKAKRVQHADSFDRILKALGSSIEEQPFLIGARPMWNNPKSPHQPSTVLDAPQLAVSLGYIHNLAEHGSYYASINELASFLRVTPRTIENRLRKAGKTDAQHNHRYMPEGLVTFCRASIIDKTNRKPFSQALAQFEKKGIRKR